MKIPTYSRIFLLFSVLFFLSCSSDDDFTGVADDPSDNGDNGDEITTINYFPLVVDNEWQYKNTQTSEGQTQEDTETLSVVSQQESGGQNLFALNSTTDEMGISFTGILSSGEVFKSENRLLITGNFDFDLQEGDLPDFDVDFEGLVVYDSEALDGSVLFSQEQTIELPEFNNIALSINLSIESISLGKMDSMEVDGVVYEDILGSQFVISMGAEATVTVPPLPFPITLDVIQFQEIVVATNYFANEIGLVYSETNLSVQFSDALSQIPDFDLDNIEALVQQSIIDFDVNLED